jgi:hypothetical protein
MRFVTEDELRDMYKEAPFTTYTVPAGVRLTPGARQFLTDRGMLDPGGGNPEAFEKARRFSPVKEDEDGHLRVMLESAKADFYKAGIDLAGIAGADVSVSGRLMGIGAQIGRLGSGADISAELDFRACTGIRPENFSDMPEDCFEIESFHVLSQRGAEIAVLHKLRSGLRALAWQIRALPGECENAEAALAVETGLNQIVNILSQMICTAFGSSTCQKR